MGGGSDNGEEKGREMAQGAGACSDCHSVPRSPPLRTLPLAACAEPLAAVSAASATVAPPRMRDCRAHEWQHSWAMVAPNNNIASRTVRVS